MVDNMVQALIHLGEHEDRVLNMVKAKFGLPNKSEAVNMVLREYEENMLEPELKPAYIERLKELRKGKYHEFSSMEELDELIDNV